MIINATLKKIVHENMVLMDNQFGFTHQLSTTHAVQKVANEVATHLHNGLVVRACLMDRKLLIQCGSMAYFSF